MTETISQLDSLDSVLRRAVDASLAARAETPQGGLYISDAEVQRLLSVPLAHIPDDRLDRLARAFDLDDFERSVVLLCLAPEIDRKYERVYAWLQDDVQSTQPTVALALSLFRGTRTAFDHDAPFQSLIVAADSPTLLARPLRLEPRIASFLLGSDLLDESLRRPLPIAQWMSAPPVDAIWTESQQAHFRALETLSLCALYGPPGAGKKTFAREVCRRRGVPLLVVDLACGKPVDAVLHSAFREATIYGVPLLLEGAGDHWPAVRPWLDRRPGLLFLTSAAPVDLPPALEIDFPIPNEDTRRRLWLRHVDAEPAAHLASLFRLFPGQIEAAAARASTPAALLDACRAVSSRNLVSFGVKVPIRRSWDDLVLPRPVYDQLQELCAHVRFHARVYSEWGFQAKAGLGCGLLALFSGPSGSGKTLAAEVVAGALGLSLFKIDLASISSKYIGDTEKNIARVLEDGERNGGILFFDEADALFGKRTEVRDARDRYANLEVNYLLQRIEDYPGVILLSSNMGRNIDKAFQRRLQFSIDFPLPDADHRRRIWRTIFPSAAPLDSGIDFDFLSERFPLSGGNIRNIALAAAFHAAGNGGIIGMHHLLLGLKRELQKMGKVCERAEFGDYYPMVR